MGANDRIAVGHIGVGGMGSTHLKHFRELAKQRNTASIAASDVYRVRLDRAVAAGTAILAAKDYRRILDNKDVDAVVIATPEHWHAQIAIHALEAGKHVYVEKPLSRYLGEAFRIYDAYKKSGKVVQVGAHRSSNPKHKVVRDIVSSGKLGPLVSAQMSYARNSREGEWNYPIDADVGPHNLDWEMWLGPAARRPWNEEAKSRYFRFRKYRDYSAGILGDLMSHFIHPLLIDVGNDDWPVKVSCIGTRKISTDREVSDTVHVTAEMQGGWTLLFMSSTVNEQGMPDLIRGQRASLYLAGSNPELKPERPYVDEIEPMVATVVNPVDSHVNHQNDWLSAVRANRQPSCNMDLALRAQAVVSLAELSETTGQMAVLDPVKRTWKPSGPG